jgi:GNAT superfamily N-acetyltransferase
MIRTRPAEAADVNGVAAVALACGQPATDSGADAAYFSHLRAHGRVEVATDDAGEVVGFGASRTVGGDTHVLTDLFISTAFQGRGIGRAILERLWSAGTDAWLTFSSQDPRALPLYLRFGMRPRWPLLYLTGAIGGIDADGLLVDRVSGAEAAAAEKTLTGVDRSTDYDYWLHRDDAAGLMIRDGHGVVAVGAATHSSIAHLVCASETRAADALLAALAASGEGPMCVALPGPHPAVPRLLARGFTIDDYDISMSSDGIDLPVTSAYSPALA